MKDTQQTTLSSRYKEPCIDCILRAMCINKSWNQIVDNCSLICDYLCDRASINKSTHPPYADMVHIKSLGKTFSVTVAGDKNMFAIGKYWQPTTTKKGYIEGDWDEVKLVINEPQPKAPPTMLMKTYKRNKNGESDNKGNE